MSLLVRVALRIRRSPDLCFSTRIRTRNLATHHDSNSFPSMKVRSTQSGTSSILSQIEAEMAAKRSQGGGPTMSNTGVGPFQLGISPEALRGPKIKPWSELSARGKAVRAAARTSNLTVILIGASLSAVLVYALATELFAKNSPTVIYGESCDRIRSSPDLARHLVQPYKFHNNPPSSSAAPPRHRNRHVASQVAVDSAGKEHLFLHFYIDSAVPNAAASKSSWLDVNWDFSYEEAVHWITTRTTHALDSARRSFAYITGTPLPPPPTPPRVPSSSSGRTEIGKSAGQGAWSFAGIFSSLKGKTRGIDEGESDRAKYVTGEVHVDLVKDDHGIYQYRYLLVDIPNSRAYRPTRVFVERDTTVREGDAIVMWE